MATAEDKQWAFLAQQALDNPALRRTRDELRDDAVTRAAYNTGLTEADEADRTNARAMLLALSLMEEKLQALVAAGAG